MRDRFRELYVMDRDGANVRQLTDARASDNGNYWRAPVWSPDGRTIAYQDVIAGSVELVAIDVATGATRRLTNNPLTDAAPLWTPDGQRLIYMAGHGEYSALYSVDADGSNPRALTAEDGTGKYPALWN
jgi:TolB protein